VAILPLVKHKWLKWSGDKHNTETQHVDVYSYGLAYTLRRNIGQKGNKKPLA